MRSTQSKIIERRSYQKSIVNLNDQQSDLPVQHADKLNTIREKKGFGAGIHLVQKQEKVSKRKNLRHALIQESSGSGLPPTVLEISPKAINKTIRIKKP